MDNWFNRSFAGSGWPFVNPEDFAFMRFGWPLRGFSLNERWGNSYGLVNLEFRFPLLFALMAGPLPSLFQGLQAQVFFDGGGTWRRDGNAYNAFGVPVNDPFLYSMGFGMRSLALGLPLRLDIAWRHIASGGFSPPLYLFSLGVDF
jgi:outer membrane protein assembly factor BamA